MRETDAYAFGFLDPAHVIRGSHLLPRFSGDRTNDLLATQQPTVARRPSDTEDWANYYVNIFVDRDMLMRYVGGGIGHQDVEALTGTDIPEEDDKDDGDVVVGSDSDEESDSNSEPESGEEAKEGIPLGESWEQEEEDGEVDGNMDIE
ncbi:hypothetical protein MVEN_01437200 [Mycena venus]|uniref:Uncharacterized protein n=1 Tax=Mycena venus TaxID=2733690 RepID=A0A8H7CSW3_9AGAR|nr:hypothetical protein MVEN_01437200 [Mycena venus]